MTHKDYELVARALKAGRGLWGNEPVAAETLNYVVGCMANLMEEDNPKFNKDRFIKAAGGITS